MRIQTYNVKYKLNNTKPYNVTKILDPTTRKKLLTQSIPFH